MCTQKYHITTLENTYKKLRMSVLIWLYSTLFIFISVRAYGNDNIPSWMEMTIRAEYYMERDQYKEALSLLRRAIPLQEESTRILMDIALCYQKMSLSAANNEDRQLYDTQYELYLKKTLRIDPIHSDARYRMDKRLGLIAQTPAFTQQEAGTLYEQAVTALESGATQAAQSLLQKALQKERHPEILKALGMIAFHNAQLKKAEKYLHDSINLFPVQYDVYIALGRIAEHDNDLPRAKEYYIRSLASYPHCFDAMKRISVINKKSGKPTRFLNIYDPLPADKRNISYSDTDRVRILSRKIQVNVYEIQCWLVYHDSIQRARQKHIQALPGIPFIQTVDTETQAIADMLEYYHEHIIEHGGTFPQFDILYAIYKKHLLKAAIFYYRWRDSFAEDFIQYRHTRFSDMVRMFEMHL